MSLPAPEVVQGLEHGDRVTWVRSPRVAYRGVVRGPVDRDDLDVLVVVFFEGARPVKPHDVMVRITELRRGWASPDGARQDDIQVEGVMAESRSRYLREFLEAGVPLVRALAGALRPARGGRIPGQRVRYRDPELIQVLAGPGEVRRISCAGCEDRDALMELLAAIVLQAGGRLVVPEWYVMRVNPRIPLNIRPLDEDPAGWILQLVEDPNEVQPT